MTDLVHYQRKYRELTLRELTAVYEAYELSDVEGSLKTDYQRSILAKLESDGNDLTGATIFHFELDKEAGDLKCHITAQLKFTYATEKPKVDKGSGTEAKTSVTSRPSSQLSVNRDANFDQEINIPAYDHSDNSSIDENEKLDGASQASATQRDMKQFASIIATTLATALDKTHVSSPKHHVNYRFKLEYSEDRGIEPFISQIESWAEASKVTNDEDIIKTAIAVLDHSEYGFAVKQAFGYDELTNWEKCKEKLIELMGHDKAYYRARFRSYRRKSGESAGMCLSKLILCFKNGFKKNSDILTESDEIQIKNQFINTLKQPIKGFVEMQESNLTLANIASATAKIERSFGFHENSESSKLSFLENEDVIMINQVEPLAPKLHETQLVDVFKAMNDQTQKMFETMTRQAQAAAEKHTSLMTSLISKLNMPNRPNNYTRQPFNFAEYKGYCVGHVKTGKCRRQADGRECSFKHGDVPAELMRLRDTRKTINSEQE